MSNTRYIEINSTYRNRNYWPLPSEFVIPISQTGKKTMKDALDPVSLSAPLFSWTSNNLVVGGGDKIYPVFGGEAIIANPANPYNIGYTSDSLNFIILTTQPIQQLKNYYTGLVLKDVTNNVVRRIVSSSYLGSYIDPITTNTIYRTQIIVFSTFSDNTFLYGNDISISDPTDFTDVNNPLIFVPNGALQENAYTSYILYNETINQYRPIISYNPISCIIKLDTSGSPTPTSMSGPIFVGPGLWQTTDNFSLRKEQPLVPQLNFLNPTIVSSIQAIIPNTSPVQIVSITTTPNVIIVTDNGLSFSTNYYKNQFLRILPYTDTKYEYNPKPTNNQANKIISYNYYQDNITHNYFGVFRIYPSFNSSISPLTLTTGTPIEILPYSYDNYNPFVYSGSLVSQQDMVCYEVQLINLTLPNSTLSVSNGGRIAFYPFIYVQLSNVSSTSAGLKNIIYSNSPNATNVIFRAPIYDVQNPLNTPFVRIDGGGMVQTIKFKPNDNLYFKVTMGTGETFDTTLPEFFSPQVPNPLSQISAVFSIKRIN